jgi:hypothetical protein
VPVTTIRVVYRTDTFKAEGLMLESMLMSYMRVGYKAEGCIVSIDVIRVKEGEVVCIVRPRSHKASKANGFRGKVGKVIKRVGRNSLREVRYEGRGRWGCISGIGCRIGSCVRGS